MKLRGWVGVCILATAQAQADIVVGVTRIIYPASAREVAVTLTNQARQPRLVQAWIDNGDAAQAPQDSEVPFLVTPPILRLEPGKGNALRIVHDADLAGNQERVYWLNVLSIPPALDPAHGQSLQFALRTRIKVFLRPRAVPGVADEAPMAVRWWQQAGEPSTLRAHNPSAYHVTLTRIQWGAQRSLQPPMIAPGHTVVIPLEGRAPPQDPRRVYFNSLDDYGRTRRHEAALLP